MAEELSAWFCNVYEALTKSATTGMYVVLNLFSRQVLDFLEICWNYTHILKDRTSKQRNDTKDFNKPLEEFYKAQRKAGEVKVMVNHCNFI